MADDLRLSSDEDLRNPIDVQHQVLEKAPPRPQLLGPFTVVCLVLNRIIGSGIFVTPVIVLNGTGSVGASLLLWTLGGLIATCGLLVWLELGLSLPLTICADGIERSVPRSGGEKNYLESIFKRRDSSRHLVVTCIYGIGFLVLGNLTGNAIALGNYVMDAAGHSPRRGPVIGIAFGALTLAVFLHVFSRRGGILINNAFAVLKILLLLMIIILGFLKAGGVRLSGELNATDNFDLDQSFATPRHDIASYSESLSFITYAYSGFQQPFYVLTEVSQPRKIFPKYTLLSMLIATTLFVLTNVAYFCAVPANLQGMHEQRNMAVVFFGCVFGNEVAKRVMSGVIAFSIFGNILVGTFTASRVKQEIAKEGILPWSVEFATSRRTPLALLTRRRQPEGALLEQTPMAALGLHWLGSIFLLAVTSILEPSIAYSFLVSLYSYTVIILNGFFVSAGLLYLKLKPNREWGFFSNFPGETRSSPPKSSRLGLLYAGVYCVACAFMLIVAFVRPSDDSPFSYQTTKIQWYLIPTIGLSVPFWGVLWYLGIRLVEAKRHKELVVHRDPTTIEDKQTPGQWITSSEIITRQWRVR